MPAMDALTAKHDFYEGVKTRHLRAYMQGYLRSVNYREGRPNGDPGHVILREGRFKESPFASLGERSRKIAALGKVPDEDEVVEEILQAYEVWTEAAETFYVHPRMNELITAASESMPPEPLLPHDLPTQQGFVLIPGGITTIDVRGNLIVHNAVLWTAYGGKVGVHLLTDKYDPHDHAFRIKSGLTESQLAQIPRFAPSHVTEIEFGEPLPMSYGPTMVVPPEYQVGVDYVKQPDGSTSVVISTDKGMDQDEMQEMFGFSTRIDPVLKWLVAMWRLMQQPLTSIEKEYPTRQQRRWMERHNLPDKHVSVVTLRRRAGKDHGDTEVHWSHRWLVRGHWRHQRYKEDGEWITRVIWIHPHIKGPDDKPLLVREHVYDLSR